MRPETKATLDYITDTFSGVDGGARFANLRSFIDQLDAQAADGDEAADEVLEQLRRMERLIRAAERLR